jgi:hypothetical protein
MPTFRLMAVAGALFVVVYGSASAAEDTRPPRAPCVFVDQIDSFQYIDEKSAILETSPSKRFKVTFLGKCRELRWAVFARVEARPGICLTKGDKLVVGRHGFEERCVITSIEALPPKIDASSGTTPEGATKP